jgi:hypothetical protein
MTRVAVPALAAVSIAGCAQLGGLSDDYVFRDDLGFDGEDGASACGEDQGPIAAIGEIGRSCCVSSGLACAGHAQKLVLVCDPTAMKWAPLQSCSGKLLCDTAPGSTQGSCQDPVSQCIGYKPLDRVCDGNKLLECGPDLLTSAETACTYACEVTRAATRHRTRAQKTPRAVPSDPSWAESSSLVDCENQNDPAMEEQVSGTGHSFESF